MKTTAVVVALLIVTLSASAQETAPAPETASSTAEQAQKIDASPHKLLELLAEAEAPPRPPRRVEVHFGRIDVRALGTRWRIGFLPFMIPFVGARFTSTKEWPDAFSMLGVQPPNTPRTFARSRQVNAEIRRIERTEKVKATIQVNTP